MAGIEDLCQRIDLHDLAGRLGLERPGGRGNYRSPHHDDRSPSLSIYQRDGRQRWKDHSNDSGGDAVDLVRHVFGHNTHEALRWLRDTYGIPIPGEERRDPAPRTLAEHVAARCLERAGEAMEYLTERRGIARAVVQRAINARTLGFNTWTSSKVPSFEPGHGGPGVAFITRTLNPGRVVGVDTRYLNEELNGGVKLRRLPGDDSLDPWYVDLQALRGARTVVITESAINAMSVESAGIGGMVGLAVRSIANVGRIDWRWLRGKRVLIGFDNDEPDQKGHRAGPEAAWALHERLTAHNIAAHLLDQREWAFNDLNDLLTKDSRETLRAALERLEPWAIPGVAGDDSGSGRRRVFLPAHDYRSYWRFRVREDFTSFIRETREDDDGMTQEESVDLCGFRLAGISKVSVASPQATMSGELDHNPETLFAVTTQDPFHGNNLNRVVCQYKQLNNLDFWQRCGPVWQRGAFLRLVSIMGRGAEIGARDVANFVGLAWQKGRLTVNEGTDCYFTDPDKQCPYSNLVFPSGPVGNAATVIRAYHRTFGQNAALLMLVWSLGGHLKALTGFWPHLTLQAAKGAGKSTLVGHLQRTIGMTVFSGQSLQTQFRLLTSIGHTSHPVGWDELSARKQDVIDQAVSILQEAYQWSFTRRGTEMTGYLNAAPVLLMGEDVPVRSLLGKVVRSELRYKGPMLAADLPVFPVRQWLEFLTGLTRVRMGERLAAAEARLRAACMATARDSGAARMVRNYAALLCCWELLCEFAGIEDGEFDLVRDLISEMNGHIQETSAEREPWVWITEILLAEIASGAYRHPFLYRAEGDGRDVLLVRTQHVMHHLRSSPGLKEAWNGLPVKSDRVYKKQLKEAGVIHRDRVDASVNGARECHLVALDLGRLEEYGLHTGRPEGDSIPAH
jgi:hypothetical protein